MLGALCIIVAVSLILFVRKSVPKYSPASVFTLFWSYQIVLLLLLFSNYLIFKYYGILYILLCILIFDFGYIITSSIFKLRTTQECTLVFNYKRARIIYYFMLSLSFIGLLHSLSSTGFNLLSLFDFQSVMELSHETSVERYSGGEESGGILQKIFIINSSATSLIGGIMLYKLKKNLRYLAYLSILPPIISGLTQGAKMGIIIGCFLFIVGLLIGSQLFNIKIKINLTKIFLLLLLLIAFMSLMVIVMMFRIGRFDIDTMFEVFGKATSYVLAHLPAFDIWFSNHEESVFSLTMGGESFFGITNFIGLMERKQGLYDKMMVVSLDGSETNVYTYFRILIEDFGSFGGLFFLFIMGGICNVVYTNFTYRHHIYLNTTILCGMYLFISWSFVTSVFVYTTYIAMMFYLFFIFKFLLKTEPLKISK